MKKGVVSSWVWGVVIFLLLGFLTRFAFLDHPNEVVFDEFHFFHFVSEYEEGEYFFDIHPPLGKLVLWANAKMHGLPEFIEDTEYQKKLKADKEVELKELKEEYLVLEKSGLDEDALLILKKEYLNLDEEIQHINTGGLETYTIGAEYHEKLNTFGLRSLPAFFGALLVPLMFGFAFFLTSSFAIASIIGILTLFSPAFLVESQYVFMDSMLMFFVVLGAFFALLYAQKPSWKWWLSAMVCAALSVSIKWTGASLIGAVGLVWLVVLVRDRSYLSSFLQALVFWVFVPLFYISTFWIHFSILTQSGEGDAFHTPEFRVHLENSVDYGRTDLEPMNFWDRFMELNVQMGERSAGIRNEHPFASRPEDWVKGEKSIYLWNEDDAPAPASGIPALWNNSIASVFPENTACRDVYQQQLHLFPNSFLWLMLTFSTVLLFCIVLFSVVKILWYRYAEKSIDIDASTVWNAGFIVIVTCANIIPFMLIERPQFLYHAFEGVLFALLGLSLSLYFVLRSLPVKNIAWILLGAISTASFLFFVIELPLIYGFSFHDCAGKMLFQFF